MEVPVSRNGVSRVAIAADVGVANLVHDQPARIGGANHRSPVLDGLVAVVRSLCPIEICVMAPSLEARVGRGHPMEGACSNRLRSSVNGDRVVTEAPAHPV